MLKERLKSGAILILILMLYSLLAGAASLRLPLSVGPDETAHFMFARYWHQEQTLPLTAETRDAAGYKSDQPPLYAMLVGLTFTGNLDAPPFVKMANGIPRRHILNDGVVDPEGFNRFWDVVNTADPMAGEVLFWHYGRLWAVGFGGLTLLVIYFIALKLFEAQTQPQWWAVVAVAVIAFIPNYIFMSAVFSYESMLGFWLAVYVLIAVHALSGRAAWWLYGLAGVVIGLAIVTKLSALPAPLSLLGLILVAGWRLRWSLRQYAVRLGAAAVGLSIGAGWWIIIIEWHLNRVAELGLVAGLLHPIIVGDASGEGTSVAVVGSIASGQTDWLALLEPFLRLNRWLNPLFRSFWLPYGEGPGLLVWVVWIVSLLAATGLGWFLWHDKSARLMLGFLLFQMGLFFILPLGRFVISQESGIAGAGRDILFPAVGAIAVLLVWGLCSYVPPRWERGWLGGAVLAAGLLVFTVGDALRYHPPTPIPMRTVPPVMPDLAVSLGEDFGPMMLHGYSLSEPDGCCIHPALGVTLHWESEEIAAEDFLNSLTLVNSQGMVQSIWMGHAANGRYPTRAWEPGDLIADEMWLPVAGLSPGEYTLSLMVGETSLTLGEIRLDNPLPPDTTLLQAGQPAPATPKFDHRATIQATSDGEVRLVGSDGTIYPATGVAGRTHAYVIDPLWPPGRYSLQTAEGASFPLVIDGLLRLAEVPGEYMSVEANFAHQIELIGYRLPQAHISPGEPLPVVIYWRALQTPPADFINFVRLRDDSWQEWGGYDRHPRESYSTLMWTAGEVVEDGFTVQTPPDMPPGMYYLEVGLYLPVPESLAYLPLVQEGQLSDVTSVTLGPFQVGALP